MAPRKKVEKIAHGKDKIIVVEGGAPKSGTEITRERLSRNLRSLNSNWTKRSEERPAESH